MPKNNSKLVLCLGIDFGTKYTKVCFRDLGRRKSKVVSSKASMASLDDALIPSALFLDFDGRYHAGMSLSECNSGNYAACKRIEYLKMRLVDLDLGHSSKIPIFEPVAFENDQTLATEAVCAFFLCQVIRWSKKHILEFDKNLVEGREVIWTSNVGVPVEYYDSPAILRFRKVFSAAWAMASDHDLIGITAPLKDIINAYRVAISSDVSIQNCFAIPEIGAAVQSFLTTRSAQNGVYVFFDVGSGTLDGVSFRYYRDRDEPKIKFYSGRVKPLGIDAMATRVRNLSKSNQPLECFEQGIYNGSISFANSILIPLKKEVQKQVAEVICQGKRIDSKGFSESIGLKKLPVFLGGGGALSPCYQSMLSATHEDFDHGKMGIPPYRIISVPIPPDLDLNGLKAEDYHRFCVSYGLTPEGELAQFSLPSELTKEAEASRQRQVSSRVTCKFCNSTPMPGDNVCLSCAS